VINDLSDPDKFKPRTDNHRRIIAETQLRSAILVPLQFNGRAMGLLLAWRTETGAFPPEKVQLLETFAAQATIAIQNARQFRELQNRLEREKASGEVLEVISTSRDDDLPVFTRIAESVSRLCDAPLAYICILNKDRTHVIIPAHIGARPEFAKRLERFREPIENNWLMAVQATLERQVIRVDDLADDDLYRQGNEYRVNMVDEEGMRSALVIPLLSADEGVGCIFLYRREVAPFSDEEVDLVRGFAAQAVIAIENVRQFQELQMRLARETGTREVLQTMSRSVADEGSVFDNNL